MVSVSVAPAAIGASSGVMLLPVPLGGVQPLPQDQVTFVKSGGTMSFSFRFGTVLLPTFFTVSVNVTGPPAKTGTETPFTTRIDTHFGRAMLTGSAGNAGFAPLV